MSYRTIRHLVNIGRVNRIDECGKRSNCFFVFHVLDKVLVGGIMHSHHHLKLEYLLWLRFCVHTNTNVMATMTKAFFAKYSVFILINF